MPFIMKLNIIVNYYQAICNSPISLYIIHLAMDRKYILLKVELRVYRFADL